MQAAVLRGSMQPQRTAENRKKYTCSAKTAKEPKWL